MDQDTLEDTEAKIRKKLLTNEFYKPNGSPLLNNGSGQYDQPNTSYASDLLNCAFVSEDEWRQCQLCGQLYGNRGHGNLHLHKETCCVCRAKFESEEWLIQHLNETIERKICCVENCDFPLNEPYANNCHFMQHLAKIRLSETVVSEKGLRQCQLCGRLYGNRRHGNLYLRTGTCCVCRVNFENEESLIQHQNDIIERKICCVENCEEPLYDDPSENDYHFKKHALKSG